jgi:hypothetical protein
MGVAYYISGILKLTYFRSDSNLPIYRLSLYYIFDAEFGLPIGGVDRVIFSLGQPADFPGILPDVSHKKQRTVVRLDQASRCMTK